MATKDEFFQQVTAAGKELDSFSPLYKAFVNQLKTLQAEDPCVVGFDKKIDALDAEAAKLLEDNIALNTKIENVIKTYENLSFFDKRDSKVISTFNTLLNNRKAINELSKSVGGNTLQPGGRNGLREKYNSCPTLKNPEEEQNTNKDPGVNEDPAGNTGTNENQSDEDRGDQSTGSGNTSNTSQQQSATSSAGTTTSGKSGTSSAKTSKKPGRRTANPLSKLSSYTYNLSLYMLTPDAYDAFINSGKRDINAIRNAANQTAANDIRQSTSGAYVVAQTAGNNNTTSLRPPGFNYDYYIDNLKIVNSVNGKATGTATNVTEFEFQVIEPYGFSFVTKLKNARDILLKNSKVPNAQEQNNALRQFFVLGIRFYGYDKNGKEVTGFEFTAQDTINPPGTGNGIFERFYDIYITDLKFKLDGKSTVYNIKAAPVSETAAMTNKYGRLNKDVQIQASTVYNALMGNSEQELGLLSSLNREQEQLLKENTIEIPNKYNVIFIGDQRIPNSGLILPSDKDKSKSSMAVTKTDLSTDGVSAFVAPNLTVKQFKFKNDTSILQAISLIIGQSQYLYKPLNTVFNSDANAEAEPVEEKVSIAWYNLSAQVEILGFDKKKQDWSYAITYIIQPYETPVVTSPFAKTAKPYYGPHKRYEYWYTGQNTEIIKYEQQLNVNYFIVALSKGSLGEDANQGTLAKVPELPQLRTPEARIGTLGEGYEAQNSYITTLYDPQAWTQVKIGILGDPDFLMSTTTNAVTQIYDPFYESDGFTINPNGGQVFIEIDFKEPVDYQHRDGLLSINESIQFVEYPKEIKEQLAVNKITGVSYTVITCTSTFRGGRFEQELTCVLNDWSTILLKKESQRTDDGSFDRAESTRFATLAKPPLSGLVTYTPPTLNVDLTTSIAPSSPEESLVVTNTSADDDRG